jgi:branched-chain amino acid transport system ATP-binding protein
LPKISQPILISKSLSTGYGKKQVIKGVTVDVGFGEIIALIGHNGAGKSTFLKVIFGLLPIWGGEIILDGIPLHIPKPREMLRKGVVYVPQGGRVFTDLTVLENLELSGLHLSGQSFSAKLEEVLIHWPILHRLLRQRATTLSGGEKQMLVLAGAMMRSPRLLLLDEPSLGLSPSSVSDLLGQIQRWSSGSGVSVLIVEQKVQEVLKIAHRAFVLRSGLVSFSGTPEMLRDGDMLRQAFL